MVDGARQGRVGEIRQAGGRRLRIDEPRQIVERQRHRRAALGPAQRGHQRAFGHRAVLVAPGATHFLDRFGEKRL